MTVIEGKQFDTYGFQSNLTNSTNSNKLEPTIDQFMRIAVLQLKNFITNKSEWKDKDKNNDAGVSICFHENGLRNLNLLRKTLITFHLYKESYFEKNDETKDAQAPKLEIKKLSSKFIDFEFQDEKGDIYIIVTIVNLHI
jgi:hypothetical protein